MNIKEQIEKINLLLEKSDRVEKGISQKWWKDVQEVLEGQVEALKENLIYETSQEKIMDIKAEIKAIRKLFDIILYFKNIKTQLLQDLKELEEGNEPSVS